VNEANQGSGNVANGWKQQKTTRRENL